MREHAADNAPIRLLLVEDDEDDYFLTMSVVRRLPGGPWRVERAASYEEAVRALDRREHDICLTDHHLGPRTGLELLDEARARGLATPIVLLTGSSDHGADMRALAAGAADYIDKAAVNVSSLGRVVRYALERARTHARLLSYEQGFRALIERLPDGICVQRDNRVAYVNPTLSRLLSLPADVIGRRCDELFESLLHPDDRGALRSDLADPDGEPSVPRERRFLPDGKTVVHAELTRYSVPFEGERCAMLVLRDVTATREMAARARVADRMASVGTLAAGVAHEINNPLAAVVTNLDFLDEELRSIETAAHDRATPRATCDELVQACREAVHDAARGADRVRRIVLGLRAFAGSDDEKRRTLDVRDVLETAIRMTTNEVRHRAVLERHFADIPPIEANEARIGNVFAALLLNAAQAIPEGHAADHAIRARTYEDPAGRVVIEVEDTGCGIPRANLGRVFDPFFTTRDVGGGVGLGLSICHATVREIGGDISLESEVGRGTRVRVRLPAADTARAATARVTQTVPVALAGLSPGAHGKRCRILAVDDEALLLKGIRRSLGAHHDVTTADSGDEALARIASGERFDLILCDVMMPQMTGVDFYEALGEVAPEQRSVTVFMTGGAFTDRARAFLGVSGRRRIDKPFTFDELRTCVESSLFLPRASSTASATDHPLAAAARALPY